MSCCSMHHSQGQNISMSIFAFDHNRIGVAETIDSTYIRCDAHQKKCM